MLNKGEFRLRLGFSNYTENELLVLYIGNKRKEANQVFLCTSFFPFLQSKRMDFPVFSIMYSTRTATSLQTNPLL